MVVYYINKVSEKLSDYHYSLKEGDICMLYDGEVVKTIYIDSEKDDDSIWRDFKFIDSKSLKSYQFPKSDCIICAPLGDKHAIGNASLLTQLSQECKGEWLLDFLNETTSVLSGFVDYWDLGILRRFTGDDEIKVSYENEEELSEYLENSQEEDEDDEEDDDNDVALDKDIADFFSEKSSIAGFCLAALSCIKDQIDERSYQIMSDTIKGVSRYSIALKHNLTQERVRQIVVKTISNAKNILEDQRKRLEKAEAGNKQLRVQYNLLKESQSIDITDIDPALAALLETPVVDIALPVRAAKVLYSMGVNTFVNIPQIANYSKVLSVKKSGRKTALDIMQMLRDFDLAFGMSYNEIVKTLSMDLWHTAEKKWIVKGIHAKLRIEQEAEEREKVVPEVKEEATIVLTEEMIEAARTPNGGFTKSQLAAIGINWPAPPGWIAAKVGTKITQSQLDGLNRIEYVVKSEPELNFKNSLLMTYKDVASNYDERRKMEAILQAMSHLYTPATPHDIARIISKDAWDEEDIDEDKLDSFLKRLPEVEYIQWGKYILKSKKR